MDTKGEWIVADGRVGMAEKIIMDEEYHIVAVCEGTGCNANAHLIAKSPKMAELLRRMVEGGWSTAIAIEAKEITHYNLRKSR